MKRMSLWTAGIVVGLWVARELRRGSARLKRLAAKTDLNRCSREDLLRIPGLTEAMADRIVENRPYRHRLDLVARMVVPSGVYQAIREQVDVDASSAVKAVNVAS